MDFHYSKEKNVQIIISLLKQYGIRKVIASPGSTNISMVASMQQDPFFEMYSSVDERSAAYMACGMAAESGEPVVLTCTSATASRNYVPGLTEAYYRKLPVLAITSTTPSPNIGHHHRQAIDRSVIQKDIANLSIHIPIVKDNLDEWDCIVKTNKALSELTHRGGGPVHINLETEYSMDFSITKLPQSRRIIRIENNDTACMPLIPEGRIGIFIGSFDAMNETLVESIEKFCESRNALVFKDHTSHYTGKYSIHYSLLGIQEYYQSDLGNLDLLIHIGNVSGDDYSTGAFAHVKEVWRISKDGEMVDTFKKLRYVFEMDEKCFFEHYHTGEKNTGFYEQAVSEYNSALESFPDIPFSNLWIAHKMHPVIPQGARLQLGILNSLRAWNLFETDHSIKIYSTVGGFGIDGGMSSLIGASLCDKNKLYFGIFGDLQFFYDMNVLGNRHIFPNVRILLINNGRRTEFRNYHHPATMFGEATDLYIAAAGHYGNKSSKLIKHYAEDLGFEYISANNKDEFLDVYEKFTNPALTNNPILFEVFTTTEDESEALKSVKHYMIDHKDFAIRTIKNVAKKVLPSAAIDSIKKIVK